METSYVVLANASSSSHRLSNTHVGVYLGISGALVSSGVAGDSGAAGDSHDARNVYVGTSASMAVASGRISYTLGLTGPCFPVDTACSASLVAIHVASTALKLVECLCACVCGEGLLEQAVFVAFSTAGMLSPLGRCHTFDCRADGYCRGEGSGAGLLSSGNLRSVIVLGTVVQ